MGYSHQKSVCFLILMNGMAAAVLHIPPPMTLFSNEKKANGLTWAIACNVSQAHSQVMTLVSQHGYCLTTAQGIDCLVCHAHYGSIYPLKFQITFETQNNVEKTVEMSLRLMYGDRMAWDNYVEWFKPRLPCSLQHDCRNPSVPKIDLVVVPDPPVPTIKRLEDINPLVGVLKFNMLEGAVGLMGLAGKPKNVICLSSLVPEMLKEIKAADLSMIDVQLGMMALYQLLLICAASSDMIKRQIKNCFDFRLPTEKLSRMAHCYYLSRLRDMCHVESSTNKSWDK